MKKIYYLLLLVLTSIISYRFIKLRFIDYDKYYEKYLNMSNKIVYGASAPRGRILDRNGKILVDNVGINTIVYHKIADIDEIALAKQILTVLDYQKIASINELKKYYLLTNSGDELLTDSEKELYNHRKITTKDVENIKLSRLDKEILNYTEEEQKLIHMYYQLNKGYFYSSKIIAEDVNNETCAKINAKNLPGLTCEYTVKRVYLYDTMNALYGNVGQINELNKDYYLKKGYTLDDTVGISYLEKEYDDYLKGTKAKYLVDKNNQLVLLENSKIGNDIMLSIDIDLQLKINEIIKKNIDLANTLKNTKYYNTSYVIISDPNTGEIIASTGLSKVNDSFKDVTSNILTSSFTVGSVIKASTISVGYQNDLIKEGAKINDSCIKLYRVPTKCSFKRLGLIDDITALKTSSNYYQFKIAIALTGKKYKKNMKLGVTEREFNIYRDTLASFGLGSSTGIDLENESLGIKGSTIADDLLLNLAIGQYDTYTPLQLTNYINTVAKDGNRYALHYLKNVQSKNNIIYEYEPKLLNTVTGTNFPRIKEGLRQVIYNGTGRGYTDKKYKPAGKTGTSEVVYSKDVTTINQTYAMFAPYDNPKYSIVVISPNISYNNKKDNYIAPINRYISKEVSKLLFENSKIYDTIGTD